MHIATMRTADHPSSAVVVVAILALPMPNRAPLLRRAVVIVAILAVHPIVTARPRPVPLAVPVTVLQIRRQPAQQHAILVAQ
eukprot:5945527-Pyramimonas_sp.AAC.1